MNAIDNGIYSFIKKSGPRIDAILKALKGVKSDPIMQNFTMGQFIGAPIGSVYESIINDNPEKTIIQKILSGAGKGAIIGGLMGTGKGVGKSLTSGISNADAKALAQTIGLISGQQLGTKILDTMNTAPTKEDINRLIQNAKLTDIINIMENSKR